MTQKTFLKKLNKIDGWFLTSAGAIRRQGRLDAECPITALGNQYKSFDPSSYYRLYNYIKAGKTLKLSCQQTAAIARAADGKGYPKLRVDLLQACHLMGVDPKK